MRKKRRTEMGGYTKVQDYNLPDNRTYSRYTRPNFMSVLICLATGILNICIVSGLLGAGLSRENPWLVLLDGIWLILCGVASEGYFVHYAKDDRLRERYEKICDGDVWGCICQGIFFSSFYYVFALLFLSGTMIQNEGFPWAVAVITVVIVIISYLPIARNHIPTRTKVQSFFRLVPYGTAMWFTVLEAWYVVLRTLLQAAGM